MQQQAPFHNRLERMFRHFGKQARKQELSCFRFYDHDLPEFPFAIDWYDGAVHMAEYKRRHGMDDEAHDAWLQECRTTVAGVCGAPQELIFIKQRQRKAGRLGQYEKTAQAKVERIVKEDGLSFILNLSDFLDTGLFLDHRMTRSMVRAEAAGKKVLNLFCYTGSFSVHATAGGAEHVTSVDLSNTYINWAKRNLQYNKLFDEQKQTLIQADVLDWLNTAPAKAFDLIICDPPTFSNSKSMAHEFDVQRDHVWLLRMLLRALAPGGVIYFSNNYTGFQLDAEVLAGVTIKDITKATTPFDFAGRLKRVCYTLRANS